MNEDIRGRWLNIRTGRVITVMNNVIDENNNMIIITNEGQISFDDFSNNYVKDDGIDEQQPAPQPAPASTHAPMYTDDMLIDDIPYDQSIMNNTSSASMQRVTNDRSAEPQNNQNDLLYNIFNKIESAPKINISVEWNDFPIDDIKTLIKYLNIDIADISKYIIEHYVSDDNIVESVNAIINEKINKKDIKKDE